MCKRGRVGGLAHNFFDHPQKNAPPLSLSLSLFSHAARCPASHPPEQQPWPSPSSECGKGDFARASQLETGGEPRADAAERDPQPMQKLTPPSFSLSLSSLQKSDYLFKVRMRRWASQAGSTLAVGRRSPVGAGGVDPGPHKKGRGRRSLPLSPLSSHTLRTRSHAPHPTSSHPCTAAADRRLGRGQVLLAAAVCGASF